MFLGICFRDIYLQFQSANGMGFQRKLTDENINVKHRS